MQLKWNHKYNLKQLGGFVVLVVLLVAGAFGGVYLYNEVQKSQPHAPTTTAPSLDRFPNATAQCKDGYYSYAAKGRGNCSGHGGVKEWL